MKQFHNLLDYARTFLKTFDEAAFSEVDSLILSWLSYLKFPESLFVGKNPLQLHEVFHAEIMEEMLDRVNNPEETRELLTAAVMSPRFRDIHLACYRNHFDEEIKKQFSALTFLLPDGRIYISFRGTDSTFVGWEEDFNMAFQYPVPAQVEAQNYLSEMGNRFSGRIMVGGHSKGGNLAVYAAVHSGILSERIDAVFSHDGPGFPKSVLDSEEFRNMSDRIHKTVPQSSVIGMLLQTHEKFRVVQSEKTGLAQHDPFSWAIENGDFLYLKDLNWSAVYLDKTLNTWIEQMKKEEREIFIRTLFSLLTTGDVKTTGELKRRWTETAPVAFASYFTMEPEKREMLKKIMGQLVSIAAQKVPEVIDERMEK